MISLAWISMSEAWPENPPEGWWIMTRELGRQKRLPLAPAASSSEPIEAAMPMQTVDTSERMYCIVSYIARPEVTTPPGELI